MTEHELNELEAAVVAALDARDDSALNVLGYGEVSVALGWPFDEPTVVCKRTPPFTSPQFSAYRGLVVEYIEQLRAAGLDVVDTQVMALPSDGHTIAYLVQPMLDSATLGHNVLKASDPDPDHPLLVAVAKALEVVTPQISIDAQFTNFSWDGATLTLIDVGTPFLWNSDGSLKFDIAPFARTLPALIRPLATRELAKLITRWNEPRRVGLDIVANLYREGLGDWVDATVTALNRELDGEPISAVEARALFDEDLKLWPALKKLQAVERWWQSTVRRTTYQWFIKSTYDA